MFLPKLHRAIVADTRSMERWLVLSWGSILVFTGVVKISSAFGNARILATTDPIFGISYHHLMPLAGLVELAVSAICFSRTGLRKQAGSVAWLATIFLGYRLGGSLMGHPKPCPCLGNLTDAIHLSPQIADGVMKILLVYLFASSYIILAYCGRSWGTCTCLNREAASDSGSSK